MGHLAPGEIFENMLRLLLSYRDSDISYRDARGFGDMIPAKIQIKS